MREELIDQIQRMPARDAYEMAQKELVLRYARELLEAPAMPALNVDEYHYLQEQGLLPSKPIELLDGQVFSGSEPLKLWAEQIVAIRKALATR